jgi:hypothetical protein
MTGEQRHAVNPHFAHPSHDNAAEPALPKRLFALLDHVEEPAPGEATYLMAFDAVSADWFDDNRSTDPLEQASKRLWDPVRPPGPSPFERMPLYRIEVEYPIGHGPVGPLSATDFDDTDVPGTGLARLESTWFQFDVSPQEEPDFFKADLYRGMFLAPQTAWVYGSFPTPQQGQALKKIFSLSHLTPISASALRSLVKAASSDFLGVYDVGQGSANALLDARGRATLYYDLGTGVYANRSTAPAALQFCWCGPAAPSVILSHWDADHWAGAYWAASPGGACPALSKTWVAPLQTVGPVHVAFAHDIHTHGKLHLYGGTGTARLSHTDAAGRMVHMLLGKGSTRNYSGIVLGVEDNARPARSWLLTGDCDYPYFLTTLGLPAPVALIAPHHGANLKKTSTPPSPAGGAYRRIVYSFGPNNKHGKVHHPTLGGVRPHMAAGWNHGTWSTCPPPPGSTIPGQDALATARHNAPQARDSVLVGWSAPPVPMQACAGTHLPSCSTVLRRA